MANAFPPNNGPFFDDDDEPFMDDEDDFDNEPEEYNPYEEVNPDHQPPPAEKQPPQPPSSPIRNTNFPPIPSLIEHEELPEAFEKMKAIGKTNEVYPFNLEVLETGKGKRRRLSLLNRWMVDRYKVEKETAKKVQNHSSELREVDDDCVGLDVMVREAMTQTQLLERRCDVMQYTDEYKEYMEKNEKEIIKERQKHMHPLQGVMQYHEHTMRKLRNESKYLQYAYGENDPRSIVKVELYPPTTYFPKRRKRDQASSSTAPNADDDDEVDAP